MQTIAINVTRAAAAEDSGPNTSRVYKSKELWPFFLLRIPSPKQSHVRAIIEAEKIDTTNDVDLLRRFGRHAVFSPFELSAESQSREEAVAAHMAVG